MAHIEANQRSDGRNYAPASTGVRKTVVAPGEFPFACAFIDHGHIYGQANGLVEAGAELRAVYDPDPGRVAEFVARHPGTRVAESLDEILRDPAIRLVASSAVNAERAAVGFRVLRAGKDFFCDKPLFTTGAQLEEAKRVVAETGRKYLGYFSERLHVECAVRAGELAREGAIGRVVQVIGLGPHRANPSTRPEWFFDPARYGGILCDIGSHQIEAFLHFTGAKDATVTGSRVANYHFREYPAFQDFGEVTLTADNGATGYFRLDWLTPKALEVWGDGRTMILGTEGYIELRKYTDIGGTREPDSLFLVNNERNERMNLRGKVGFPFFGEMILDCLNRTEKAMTQAHIWKTMELAIAAQETAVKIE